jgi:hypothetical protein
MPTRDVYTLSEKRAIHKFTDLMNCKDHKFEFATLRVTKLLPGVIHLRQKFKGLKFIVANKMIFNIDGEIAKLTPSQYYTITIMKFYIDPPYHKYVGLVMKDPKSFEVNKFQISSRIKEWISGVASEYKVDIIKNKVGDDVAKIITTF